MISKFNSGVRRLFFLSLIMICFSCQMSSENSSKEIQNRVSGVELNKTSLELEVGGSEILSATITPESAINKDLFWTSDNTDIVSVDNNGKVTANKEGNTYITARTKDGGFIAICSVKSVKKFIAATGITLSSESLEIQLGKKATLSAIINPENVSNNNVIYESADEAVATISEDGVITPVKVGCTTITAKSEDGNFVAQASIRVTSHLTFSSENQFSIKSRSYFSGSEIEGVISKLYYSTDYTDEGSWQEWNGNIINSVYDANIGKYVLYIRGVGNTRICNYDSIAGVSSTVVRGQWLLNGEDVYCSGDIRSVLNYDDIESTLMDPGCFRYLFMDNKCLITPPELPATRLNSYCYYGMFYNCERLAFPPELPAEILMEGCYCNMFYNCKALSVSPVLPATTLAKTCYSRMFYNCTSLKEPSALPATTLADFCYYNMFRGCTSLISIPALLAPKLVVGCYEYMFYNCTSIYFFDQKPEDESLYRPWFIGVCTVDDNDVNNYYPAYRMFNDITTYTCGKVYWTSNEIVYPKED